MDRNSACRIARSGSDWLGACRLLHDRYVERGLVTPSPWAMRVTPAHLRPTTDLLVHCDDAPRAAQTPLHRLPPIVATMALVGDSEFGLPMEMEYRRLVARKRMGGVRLAEVTSLAVQFRRRADARGQLLHIFRLLAQTAVARGVEELLIAVHPRHAPFYRRFAAFQPIGELRSYRNACYQPALALSCDLRTLPIDAPQVHERFFGVALPEQELAPRPLPEHVRGILESVVESTPSDGRHVRAA